ncbi:sunset domain-containing protein [Leucobacter sp. GX24907]
MRRALGLLMAAAMVLGGAVAVETGAATPAHAAPSEGIGVIGTDDLAGGGADTDDIDADDSGEEGAGEEAPGEEVPDEEAPDETEPPAPEIIAGTVKIPATATVGQTLKAETQGWQPAGVELSYEWLRNGALIPDAIKITYKLQASDLGKKISVRVTGTHPGYAERTVVSAQTKAIAAGVLKTATPKVSGKAIVGQTVKASAGSWTAGTKFSYQWKRNGKSIKGATKSSYKLKSADAKAKITVTVTGKLTGYTTAAKTSKATAAVLRTLTATPKPKVTGTVRAGSVVKAQPGNWKPVPVKLGYRWYRDGKAIKGATKSTYRLTKSDAGKKITVQVRGAKSGYVSVTKTSAAKKVPKVLKAAKPKISGSVAVGKKLVAKRGTWTSGTKFSYQWKRNGKSIKGATKSSYKVKAADLNARITLTVKGMKKGYASEVRTSAKTKVVKYPNRAAPASLWDCPAWAPIKGNASSMIYHVRGGAYYTRTIPEDCFRTEAAARHAGYRRSMR